MAAPFELNTSDNTNQTARGESGISGGTAFNIGGINLGTQYPTAATAGGTTSPLGGSDTTTLIVVAAVVAVGAVLVALLWKRR